MPAHGVPRFLSASHSNDSRPDFDASAAVAGYFGAGASLRRSNGSAFLPADAAAFGGGGGKTAATLWNGPFLMMLLWTLLAVFALVVFGLLWFRRNNLYLLMPWSR